MLPYVGDAAPTGNSSAPKRNLGCDILWLSAVERCRQLGRGEQVDLSCADRQRGRKIGSRRQVKLAKFTKNTTNALIRQEVQQLENALKIVDGA